MSSDQSSISDTIQNSVLSSIKEFGLLNSKMSVSFSGGPDSLTLLHVLHTFANDEKIQIIGAHLNHNIRENESITDEKYVKNIFEKLGMIYEIGNFDVPKLSKDLNISIEEAARKARHEFLYKVNKKHTVRTVAMGHNLDDQAESILMHIMRGSGTNGLKGMELLSTRTIDGKSINIFRPLLNFLKSDIEKYCEENSLTPVIDSTNLSPQYNRNFVRLNILPIMEKYNPSIKKSLVRLSKISSQDLDFINKESDGFWEKNVKEHKNHLSISITELINAPKSISSRILIRGISHFQKNYLDISLSDIESLMRIIKGETGRQLQINIVLAIKQYDSLLICENSENVIPIPVISRTLRIKIPGTTKMPGWLIQTSYENAPKSTHTPQGILGGTEWLKKDLGNELYIRTRKDGDLFNPSGLEGKKKLKTFMIDSKIPQLWRDRIPLISINKKVAWVVGWRIAEWARPEPLEKAIKIEFKRNINIR